MSMPTGGRQSWVTSNLPPPTRSRRATPLQSPTSNSTAVEGDEHGIDSDEGHSERSSAGPPERGGDRSRVGNPAHGAGARTSGPRHLHRAPRAVEEGRARAPGRGCRGASRLRRTRGQRGRQDLRGGRFPLAGSRAVLGARARRAAGRLCSTRSWDARRPCAPTRAGRRPSASAASPISACAWSIRGRGHYGVSARTGTLRLVRALTWVRSSPLDNGYARPIENLITVVDLNAMKVVRVEDGAVVPLPPNAANYTAEAAGAVRTDLKPIEIRQPEGASFDRQRPRGALAEVAAARRVQRRARGWCSTASRYQDGDRERSILERASVVDMVVPYGDPRPHYNRRNAFDVGEYGIGMLANSLSLGCDCLGEIRYFDAVLNDSKGQPVTDPERHLHARGGRRHPLEALDLRTGRGRGPALAPAGRLVHRDGRQLRVRLLLVLLPGRHAPARGQDDRHRLQRRLAAGETPPWGSAGRARRLRARSTSTSSARGWTWPWTARRTRSYEVQHGRRPSRARQPARQRLPRGRTPLPREVRGPAGDRSALGPLLEDHQPRGQERLGQPAAYKLVPGDNVLPFARTGRAGHQARRLHDQASLGHQLRPERAVRRPATTRTSTPAAPACPSVRGAGPLARRTRTWCVWYTFGAHHVARPEDWPVMPGGAHRVHAAAGRLLRPEPGPGRPATRVAHGQCCHSA